MIRSHLLAWAFGLLAVGEVLPDIAPYGTLGAAGMIAFLYVLQHRETVSAREARERERDKERLALTAIHDRLHEDSVRLNDTLTALRENCARVIADRK